MEKNYVIENGANISFNNNVDYCVGTGRIGLALQKEYQEQLKLVQEKIGFKYIRGHGLFSDDMAIYQEYEDKDGKIKAEYNFTYLDLVMDNYLEVGIKPFIELGFMPDKMASGKQTVFYWKGNVTPPKDYNAWAELVKETLRHLIKRYGENEVLTWPIEVWNEPNLRGFWENADMDEYFKLFECSFKAVKEVDARLRVGGPAICGVDDERWIRSFLEFCKEKSLKIDFVTRHHYTSELPERDGHYSYVKLHDLNGVFDSTHSTREIVDSFDEFKGAEIHITEFNTSYVPNAIVHDTNYNAAYIAYLLSKMGDDNESYSYWTFGDIFEEMGVPFTPFHGGFGLVANGKIPKPTFWAFQFFKQLTGSCVLREEDSVIVKTEDGKYKGVCWNLTGAPLKLNFNLPAAKGSYCMVLKTVDENVCNPLKLWHDMGEPSSLTKNQLSILREGSSPFVSSNVIEAEKALDFSLTLDKNAVVYFEVEKTELVSDRGFSYERALEK